MGKPCGHPDPAAGCRVCHLARHDARYMRLWGIPGEAEPVPAEKSGRVGYGDAVAWATGKLGLKPCGGCSKRRKALNKLPTPADLWRRLRGRG